VEARVQALLEAVDNTPERARPCDLQKLIHFLKLRKACGIDDLPRRPLVHLTQLITASGFHISPRLGRKQK
jgi:hypothetical protein